MILSFHFIYSTNWEFIIVLKRYNTEHTFIGFFKNPYTARPLKLNQSFYKSRNLTF